MTALLISSSVLIAAILLLRQVFGRRISARLRYALWAVVLLRLLLPVSPVASPVSIENAAPVEGVVQYIESRTAALPQPFVPQAAPAVVGETVVSDETAPAQGRQGLAPKSVLTGLWLAGTVVCASWMLLVNLRFYRRLFKDRRRTDAPGGLPVYTVRRLPSPCLAGLLRPAIYIDEATSDPEARLHIIAHETAHFRHLDHIWALLRNICVCVYWFHPLVWAAAILSKHDSETAADETAVRLLGERARFAYGRTLLGLVPVRTRVRFSPATATTMTGSRKGMRERVTRLAKKPKRCVFAAVFVLLAVGVAAAVTFTGGNFPDGRQANFIFHINTLDGSYTTQPFRQPTDTFKGATSVYGKGTGILSDAVWFSDGWGGLACPGGSTVGELQYKRGDAVWMLFDGYS